MHKPLPWSRKSYRIKLRTIFELVAFPTYLERAELFGLQSLADRVFALPGSARKLFLERYDRAADEVDASYLADVTSQVKMSHLPEPDKAASLERLAARESRTQDDETALDEIRRIVRGLPPDLQEEFAERVLEKAGQKQRSPRTFIRGILRLPQRYRSGLIQTSLAILDELQPDDQETAE